MENEEKKEIKKDSEICPQCGSRNLLFPHYDVARDLLNRICRDCGYTDWCDYYGNPYRGGNSSR